MSQTDDTTPISPEDRAFYGRLRSEDEAGPAEAGVRAAYRNGEPETEAHMVFEAGADSPESEARYAEVDLTDAGAAPGTDEDDAAGEQGYRAAF